MECPIHGQLQDPVDRDRETRVFRSKYQSYRQLEKWGKLRIICRLRRKSDEPFALWPGYKDVPINQKWFQGWNHKGNGVVRDPYPSVSSMAFLLSRIGSIVLSILPT